MKRVLLATGVLSFLLSVTAFAELSNEDVQKIDANYSLAVSYISKGDYEKAEEYLDACLGYDQEEMNSEFLADVLLKKGCMQTIRGDNTGAMENLDKAIELNKELSDAYLVKSQISIDEKNFEDAAEAMQLYIDLTENTEMYESLSEIYAQIGNEQKAQESYQAYIDSIDETNPQAVYDNAVHLMNSGKNDEAIQLFEKIRDHEELGASARYNQAVCELNQGKYDEAREAFRALLEEEQKFDGIYYNLGICAMMVEEYPRAIANYQESIETESFVNEARRNLALCYIDQENYDDALTELNTLINDETELADEARYFRASVKLFKEDADGAIEDLTTCIDHGYEKAQSYYMRAHIYQDKGEEELYLADLEEYLKN